MKKISDLCSMPLLLFLAMIASVLSFEYGLNRLYNIVILLAALIIIIVALIRARPALIIALLILLTLIFRHEIRIVQSKAAYNGALEKIELAKAVVGQIDSYPELRGERVTFTMIVVGVRCEGVRDFVAVKPFKVLVGLSGPGLNELSRGDRIKIQASIKLPRERIYDFAYRRYLFYNNIYGVLYIKEESLTVINDKMPLDPLRGLCRDVVWRMRTVILNKITSGLDERIYPFILAIFLGRAVELDSETYSTFQDSGMVHLLAISGLHIGFLGLLIFKGANFFLSSSKSYLISLLFLSFYILLISPSASSYRAFIMFMAGALFFVGGCRAGGVGRLAISGVVLLFVNPYSLFNLGFQFSFLATGGILLYGKRIEERLPVFIPAFLRANLAVTLAAFSSIALIQVSHFGRLPLFSLVSSLLVVPLFSLLFPALFFLLAVFLITGYQLVARLIEFLSHCFLQIIELLARIPPLELPQIPSYSAYILFGLLIIGDSFCWPYLLKAIRKHRLRRLDITLPILFKDQVKKRLSS